MKFKNSLYLKYFVLGKIFRKNIVFTDSIGNKYWQYPSDEIIFNIKRNSVSDSQYLERIISKIVKKNWICIDIGSKIGAITIPLWKRVGSTGIVYSIDAEKKNENIIKENLRLNNFPDNFVYTLAIYSKNTHLNLHIIDKQDGWQSLGDPRNDDFVKENNLRVSKRKVRAVKLDCFVKEHNVEKIDLLKVDVEGAELDVFRGAKELLGKSKINYIIFEVAPRMYKWFNRTPESTIKYLEKYDYIPYKINIDGRIEITSSEKWPNNLHGDCLAVNKKIHNIFIKNIKLKL